MHPIFQLDESMKKQEHARMLINAGKLH